MRAEIPQNNVITNFIYSSGYQILKIVLPLITIPYVTRVLGADNLGIYNYTNACAVYFAMFAFLGFENYGNRLIAQKRDDQQELNRAFTSAYCLQIISSTIAIVAYTAYILVFCQDNRLIAWIQMLYIASEAFNVTWLYFGLEQFKTNVIINLIVRLLAFASTFLFVRDQNDLPLYTLICAGSTLLSTLLLWLHMRKYVSFVKVSLHDVRSHTKGCFILFFPVLVISIYRTMDKIMLGNMSMMSEVAIYSYADKIVEMPYGIIAALGVVMLPRMSNYYKNGEKQMAERSIEVSMRFMLFMSCAMAFGLMGIGRTFAPIYFGKAFTKCGTLIMVIAPMIIIRACANVVRTQYLLPNKRDKDYIISILIGVIINLVLNSLMIPKWESTGAAVATLFAESFVALYQIFACRKELPVVRYTLRNWFFLLAGMIMFGAIYMFGKSARVSLLTLIEQIGLGVLLYLIFAGGYLYLFDKELRDKLTHFKKNI